MTGHVSSKERLLEGGVSQRTYMMTDSRTN